MHGPCCQSPIIPCVAAALRRSLAWPAVPLVQMASVRGLAEHQLMKVRSDVVGNLYTSVTLPVSTSRWAHILFGPRALPWCARVHYGRASGAA